MTMIILDRDGVINYDSDAYIKSVDEFIPIPGSLEAIVRLNAAGIRVAVVTNQSGIARGYYDVETLQAMHQKLARLLTTMGGKIDRIYFCPHGPTDNCLCRKPKPGMLQQALQDLEDKASNTTMIGDSISDLSAAEAAGIGSILVKTGKGARSIKNIEENSAYNRYQDIAIYDDLNAAVTDILLKASGK